LDLHCCEDKISYITNVNRFKYNDALELGQQSGHDIPMNCSRARGEIVAISTTIK